jgi:predicted nucleic acid-binding protein
VKLGAVAEARFLQSIPELIVESPQSQDWQRMSELVERYRGFPLGSIDASVIALAERLGIHTLLTLDHRHFRAIKPKHVEAFTMLPEL